MAAPTFEVELDKTRLDTRFSQNNFTRATKKALRVVGDDYAKRVHEGFKAEGVNPKTGVGKFWPKLQIPKGPTKKGGRTKRGKILKKSGTYLKATHPENASILIRGSGNTVLVQVVWRRLPVYAQYHEQQGNAKNYTTQLATARQAAFLRYLGFRGVSEGSIITLPARRVFVYPPIWKGVHARMYARELKKELGV
jgi:hypothetical protein